MLDRVDFVSRLWFIPNRLGKGSEAKEKCLNENQTFCGILLAVSRVLAHPVKQGVEHEAVTEQTNRN
jgi:hypothetical protein